VKRKRNIFFYINYRYNILYKIQRQNVHLRRKIGNLYGVCTSTNFRTIVARWFCVEGLREWHDNAFPNLARFVVVVLVFSEIPVWAQNSSPLVYSIIWPFEREGKKAVTNKRPSVGHVRRGSDFRLPLQWSIYGKRVLHAFPSVPRSTRTDKTKDKLFPEIPRPTHSPYTYGIELFAMRFGSYGQK